MKKEDLSDLFFNLAKAYRVIPTGRDDLVKRSVEHYFNTYPANLDNVLHEYTLPLLLRNYAKAVTVKNEMVENNITDATIIGPQLVITCVEYYMTSLSQVISHGSSNRAGTEAISIVKDFETCTWVNSEIERIFKEFQ